METAKVITPYFENGVFAGVRVTLGDEDFVIAPKDFRFRKEMPWQEAMDGLKVDGLSTFDYRQICHTMPYIKGINKMLRDNGGDVLDDFYWICTEYSAWYSFCYDGYHCTLSYSNKLNPHRVRPVKNLKKLIVR